MKMSTDLDISEFRKSLIADINESGLMDTAETIRKLGRRVVPGIRVRVSGGGHDDHTLFESKLDRLNLDPRSAG